jgi:septal ring factor EnvC (AmiA/AmiB activator)
MDNEKHLVQLANRMDSLEQGQQKMQQDILRLDARLENVETRLEKVETRLEKVETRLENVEKAQLRFEVKLENEVIDKIRGLYEFQRVQENVNNQVLAALARIENKLESHDIQIHILDKTKANKRKVK